MKSLQTTLRVGWFLAWRDLKRASCWTTALIIFVMTLTFLNLVIVGGILVGLIEGSVSAHSERYSADIIISSLNHKNYIENSQGIINAINQLPEVDSLTTRYTAGARLEAGYKEKTRQTDTLDTASALIAGISPDVENKITGISNFIVEGRFLHPNDYDKIVIGANLLYKYTPIDSPGLQTLKKAGLGSRVRLTVGDISREVEIIGIIKSKVGELDQRIFMVDKQLRQLIQRNDLNVNEIAIRLYNSALSVTTALTLKNLGFDQYAKIQTSEEAIPKFLDDIKMTFALLGNLVGGIGLIVASITIFIVIFVNAITRRKYIGILKGIGVTKLAIQISYIIQALVYATNGTGVGLILLYLLIKPYFNTHPINFPFSDGILVANFSSVLIKIVILFFATALAGYIPARIISRQNTLDAILGR